MGVESCLHSGRSEAMNLGWPFDPVVLYYSLFHADYDSLRTFSSFKKSPAPYTQGLSNNMHG